MKNQICLMFSWLLLVSVLTGCRDTEENGNDYPIKPVPFTSVKLTDDFWAPRIVRNHKVTIPIAIEQSTITGRIKNFEVAGGLEEGEFCSIYPFDDSDVFKIIEGASYSLQTNPDPALEQYLDSLIRKIGLAQEEDGYLYTYRTIMGDDSHEWIGSRRWEKTHELSHELYNMGHMIEAAVAHYQATGKKDFLEIATKAADLMVKDFGYGKLETYPGHQEIELALVKLFRVTGEKAYLDLAKFFLDVRGPEGDEYNQAHLRVTDQTEAVGHAVRACYMYAGMADVAAMYQDSSYLKALKRIWEDVVFRKTYITGGIGATGGNEGFAGPYVLPNATAYCETCASVANVFWNYRMFLHHGEAGYLDVLERTLYNALLSGVSLSGDLFFYPNPLESDGKHQRKSWFGCACCPSNLSRFIPSLPGYLYATSGNNLYVNLYAAGIADLEVNNLPVRVIQETRFPLEGEIRFILEPNDPMRFRLKLRIPGWAREEAIPGNLYRFLGPLSSSVKVSVNGEPASAVVSDGYLVLDRKWRKGDKVDLYLPMEVRKIVADEKVEADRGSVALQRGPLVFCAEWPDQVNKKVLDITIKRETVFTAEEEPGLLDGTVVLKGKGMIPGSGGTLTETEVKLIPYHLWNNRGPGEMRVWLPVSGEGNN